MTNQIANELGMRMSYKAYSTGVITPGAPPSPATDPTATGAQELRRVSSSLALTKSTFTAQEHRADRQVEDFRHGGRRVTGNIVGELSPKTFQDFMAASVRGAWVAGTTITQATGTSLAASASGSTMTLGGGGSWAALGYRTGDPVRCSGLGSPNANAGNNFWLTGGVSGLVANVYPAPIDMSAETTFSLSVPGRKLFPPSSTFVVPKFGIEHYYSDTGIAHLFEECRIGSMKVTCPPNGIGTIEFGAIGRDMAEFSGGGAPFFTSPTAPTTTTLVTTFGGQLLIGGVAVAIITGCEFTVSLGSTAQESTFSKWVSEIFTGTLRVTGQLTALLFDGTLLDYFVNESQVEVILALTTADSPSADFVSFFLPCVKFSGAQIQNQGEAGVPITLPFTAIKKPTTTGYDAATIVITDSLSA